MGIRELAGDAWGLVGHRTRVVLGVAGPPGAGKSTVAQALVAEVERAHGPGAAAYLPLDGFHLSNAQLARLGLTDRKGSEPSFDVWGYVALLRRVLDDTARDVYVPDYDRTLHEPVAARHRVAPVTRLVVTEGNYLACALPGWQSARELLARCWYVTASDDERRDRLVARQLAGGRTAEGARRWVETNDWPNGELVERFRDRCDRVLTTRDTDGCEAPADLPGLPGDGATGPAR